MSPDIRIIGSCQYCHRDVGSDLRPINVLTIEQLNKLTSKLKKSTSKMSDLKIAASKELFRMPLTATDEETQSNVVETVLDMVQEEFDRTDNSETAITEDKANFIISMLAEEQLTYDHFLDKEVPRLMKAELKKRLP